MNKFTKRLIKDSTLIPLWSNIYSNKFIKVFECNDNLYHIHGRIPATSAPVEGEINKYKNVVLHDVKYPIRVDDCMDRYLDYLLGRGKIANASLATYSTETVESMEENPEIESVLNDIENWRGQGNPRKKENIQSTHS